MLDHHKTTKLQIETKMTDSVLVRRERQDRRKWLPRRGIYTGVSEEELTLVPE
jgi:hypothetical protein